MPTPRFGHAVGVANGVLYTVGGFNSASAWLTTVEAYDPATNAWTTRAPMPTPRQNLAIGVVNNVLYAVGGFNGACLSTLEAYNPATDGALIESTVPIAVERVMYSSATSQPGVMWAAGTDATATPIP